MSTHASEQTGLASFPLSPQQELLWELGAEAPGYRAQCAVEVPSGWTAAHLRGALDTVVRRHEVLRTVFVRPQGMRLPAQAVLDRLDPDWQVERVDALTDVDLDRLLADEVAFAFDLERGPIVRARHVSSTGGPGLLVLTLPSVTADAVSLVAMVGELAAALEEEGAPEVPEEPLQYADYAGWRNETLAERDAGAQGPDEDGVSPVLLFGRETTSVPSFSADRIRIPLADAVIAGIEGAAAALRTTPRLFAEACWHACVARVAGAEDLAAASVFDGRTHAELGGAVGPYAQSSPVTTRSDADTSLAELVDQVRRAAEQLAIRQDSLDASALARTSARCRIGFAAFDAGPVALRTPGNTELLGVRTLFARSTRFDLRP